MPLSFLKKATLIYLTVPYIIFYFGWLRLPFALSSFIAGFILLYLFSRQDGSDKELIFKGNYTLILSFCFVLIWLLPSGIGGIGNQNSDYIKHNAILFDLVNLEWPVSFERSNCWLVYYTGYYLPSAMVGKLFNSYYIAERFSLIWAFVGITLSIVWWLYLTRYSLLPSIIFFILFSGMDAIGFIVMYGNRFEIGTHLEWWSRLASGAWDTRIWAYNSNTTHLYWAPQHAIPAWLATPIIISALESKNNKSLDYALTIASTLLWSPFVTIGLLPFVIYKFWRDTPPINITITFSSLIFVSMIPIIVYFFSQNSNIP